MSTMKRDNSGRLLGLLCILLVLPAAPLSGQDAPTLRLDEELPVSAHANSFGGSTLFLRQGERVEALRGVDLQVREGEIFTWFAGGFTTARVERDARDGTAVVHVDDHRYGLVTQPGWAPFGARFEFSDTQRPPRAVLVEHRADLDVMAEIAASWNLLLGRTPAP